MLVSIKKNCHGFTLVELNVSLLILGLVSAGVLTLYSSLLVIIVRTNTLVSMTADSQNLLRSMVEQLRYGAGVRSTNSITDPNAPTGGWNTSNTDFVIIIAAPATDSDNNYIIDSNTGSPYLNELVYYKEGTNLMKRTLAHSSAAGNSLRTTCPASVATQTCTADVLVAENIESVVFTLYDQDNVLTNNPVLARSIKIAVNLERETLGNALAVNNDIRITLRNTF